MFLQFAGEVSMPNEQGEYSGMCIHRDPWVIRPLQDFSISESQSPYGFPKEELRLWQVHTKATSRRTCGREQEGDRQQGNEEECGTWRVLSSLAEKCPEE